ncbi:hypothetical protein JHD48_07300 [Sulfurimonas sp. SAG-AH-194-I05]|nr:hypothetical protein [Sulfurimonas sp. SAG-AH-194-I05]MDF1875536.1 hypothetical protein [Sulfurimonas sp. SAG-AH-194-I05]
MRSRDGNNYRSLAICSVILFYSLSVHASEYLISYRYVLKDLVLYNESLQISRAMQKCQGSLSQSLILNTLGKKNFKQIINNNAQKFIDFIHENGMHVEHKSQTKNFKNTSVTILTLKTTCFKVDFNENLVRITSLN